ncbi:glucose-6-phosphate dehydrogenase [Paenibacillus sp. CMAA1364]
MAENLNLEELQNPNAVFFLFGATGDLARRKLFPAIYSLYREGKLAEDFAVIGIARRPRTQEEFREDVYKSIQEFCRYKAEDMEEWYTFAQHFEYKSLDINDINGFRELKEQTERIEERYHIPGNRMFYLALAPELFGSVSSNLEIGGMLDGKGWNRLVIEKPFGYDLKSAEILNEQIRQVFKEEEIYRIDHYLGKEMVQNIEVIRFSNALFEPLWNNKHIANIQITLSETVGVEERGGYYDNAGAMKDMGQNHMLQTLAMVAMEPPSRLLAEDIRDEKVKVLRSLRPYLTVEEVERNVIRGQYVQGNIGDTQLPAYRDEDKVNPNSNTETYFATRLFVDNFRWAGVPFYIRTGKRLPVKTTEIVVEFRSMPTNVYLGQKHKLEPNLLVIRVNPMEGIYFKINAKKPGSEADIQSVAMDFCQSCMIGINSPEAYERLLHDAARGESTYFTRWDEVASAWSFVDRIAEAWAVEPDKLSTYAAGTWGPKEAEELLEQDGFHWWPVNGQDEDNVVWQKLK